MGVGRAKKGRRGLGGKEWTMEGREGSEREGRGHEEKGRGEIGQVEKNGGLEGRKGPRMAELVQGGKAERPRV